MFSGALSSEDALSSIDINVILLVAEILAKTGFFQWSMVQRDHREPWRQHSLHGDDDAYSPRLNTSIPRAS